MYYMVIEHDNGNPGSYGFGDGMFHTKKEALAQISEMKKMGINVYNYTISKANDDVCLVELA